MAQMPKKRQVAKEKALHVASAVSAKVQDGVHMMSRRVQGEDQNTEEGAGLLTDDGVATHAHDAMAAKRGDDGWPAAAVKGMSRKSSQDGGKGTDDIATAPRKATGGDQQPGGIPAGQSGDDTPSRRPGAGQRSQVEMEERRSLAQTSKYSAVQIDVGFPSPPSRACRCAPPFSHVGVPMISDKREGYGSRDERDRKCVRKPCCKSRGVGRKYQIIPLCAAQPS